MSKTALISGASRFLSSHLAVAQHVIHVGAPSSGERSEGLDVLRGFAALWVVLSHYLPHWDRFLGPTIIVVPNEWGRYAVMLFFVISGYVIFRSLGKQKSVIDFIINRFSRLYPAYLLTLLLATAVSVYFFDQSLWVGGLIVNATMLQEFLGFKPFDVVYWSLTVEIAFYIFIGTAFALGFLRRPLLVVVVWLAASCAWSQLATPLDPQVRDYPELLLALDYAPYFAIGIVFSDATQHGWSPKGIVTLAFCGLTELLANGWVGMAVAVICTALVFLALRGNLSIMVSKVTLWLGTISYALYLSHRNLGYLFLDWMHKKGLGPEIAVPIVIGGALILASIVTYGVERPLSKRLRQWNRDRSPQTETATTLSAG